MVIGDAFRKIVKFFPFTAVSFFLFASFLVIPLMIFIKSGKEISQISIHQEYILYVLRTSLIQSFISSCLVLLFGFFIAKALFRRSSFFGRDLIFDFLNVSYAVGPIIVAVGLINIYGAEGWVASYIDKRFDLRVNDYLYGIEGVIFVHLVYNLPFAIRAFYNALKKIPNETLKLVGQLDISCFKRFFLVELPAIKDSIHFIFAYVFIFAFTSFILVLILGGGVLSSTTFEISVFEAIKLDFNVCLATFLSAIQFMVCLLFVLIIFNTDNNFILEETRSSFLTFNYYNNYSLKLYDFLMILLLIFLCVIPLISVIKQGVSYKIIDFLYSNKFLYVLKKTLFIACSSSFLSIFISFSLISGAFYAKYNLKNISIAKKILNLGNFKLVISGYILVNGILLLSSSSNYIFEYAEVFLILVTALSSLPIVINILYPSSLSIVDEEINLCKQLDINDIHFLKYMFYPKVKKHLGFAFSFGFIFALGDLNLIALISSNKLDTIPNLIFAALRSYNFDEATIVAFILLFVSFFVFWIVKELTAEN